MKLKNIISVCLAAAMLLSGSVFAQTDKNIADTAGSADVGSTGTEKKDNTENKDNTNDKENTENKNNTENTEGNSDDPEDAVSAEFDIYQSILMMIENIYIDDTVDKDELFIKGVSNLVKENPDMLANLFKATFEELDMYSTYYTKEEYDEYMKQVNSVFYGIGIVMKMGDNGYVVVNEVISGGPAEEAGLKVGDEITAVDGTDLTGLDMDAVRNIVVGEIDTPVDITVKRGENTFTYTVKRGEVNYSTVSGAVLEGNIGYIQITNFAENTSQEFVDIADQLKADGVKKLILDLRNNPGGYMVSAVQIASELIPEGRIIEVKYRQEENNTVYTSSLKEVPFDICVLANANTASAAEILTSSIVDSGAGILVGDTTYGKALVQDMYRMPYGQAMKMTIGEYITRNGNKINKVGIEPDKFVLNEKRPMDASGYTPFQYSGKYSAGDSGADVKAAEERLARMGYDVGDVDENYTEKTAKAVEQYQKDINLFPYGVLDLTTQVSINNTFLELTEIVDKQFDYAYEYLKGKN